ncbi:CCD81 protein, partial [Pteruthius melanotis]|nr:CCD81 protein [Pteruthius melanotis]
MQIPKSQISTSKSQNSTLGGKQIPKSQKFRLQGVRIPTLGALDVVPWQAQVGDMEVTTRRPIFCLARNLVQCHNLMDDWEFQPGNLDPLRTFAVAAVLGLPRRRVEGTLQTTMSLLSRCLGTGEDVALVLKDIGVLLVERRK